MIYDIGDRLLNLVMFLSMLFIPLLLNVLAVPFLLIRKRSGRFKDTDLKNYLLVNGFFSLLNSWLPYLYFPILFTTLVSYHSIFIYVFSLGIAFQEIFFVIWLVCFLRKKGLGSSYYKTWGWGFMLLYLFPGVIYLIWVLVSFLMLAINS